MIPKEFWERFKKERITVNCRTEDEAEDFVRQCYANGIEWFNSTYDSSYNVNTTDYKRYENGIYYKILFDPANKISFIDENMNYCRNNNYTIIPYSEINKSPKEENKMSDFNYRGKEFNDPVEFANYILKCSEEDKIKAEQIKREKLLVDKARRTEELKKAYDNYVEVSERYHKDYNVVLIRI